MPAESVFGRVPAGEYRSLEEQAELFLHSAFPAPVGETLDDELGITFAHRGGAPVRDRRISTCGKIARRSVPGKAETRTRFMPAAAPGLEQP